MRWRKTRSLCGRIISTRLEPPLYLQLHSLMSVFYVYFFYQHSYQKKDSALFVPSNFKLSASQAQVILDVNISLLVYENENENCTILIPKGNSYCCRKSSARKHWFKVSSEGPSTEIDIPLRSPIHVQTKADFA